MAMLPPNPILQAADRWIKELRYSRVPRVSALFNAHPRYADLTPTQYGLALSWLREMRVVGADGALAVDPKFARSYLLKHALLDEQPLWLPDSDRLIHSVDDLPEDVLDVGQALGLSPGEVLRAVRNVFSKVDTTRRKEIGSAGEIELLRLLKDLPEASVTHVAAYADGLGYDIMFNYQALTLHLEVKTTTRRGRLVIYLSRNEFNTMLEDPEWVLVVVLLGSLQQIESVVTIDKTWVEMNAPKDVSPFSNWDSVRLNVPRSAVRSGIVQIEPYVSRSLAPEHVLRAAQLLVEFP